MDFDAAHRADAPLVGALLTVVRTDLQRNDTFNIVSAIS